MDVNGNNTIKKALEQRETTGLPSNFSFRMMEQVRAETDHCFFFDYCRYCIDSIGSVLFVFLFRL